MNHRKNGRAFYAIKKHEAKHSAREVIPGTNKKSGTVSLYFTSTLKLER